MLIFFLYSPIFKKLITYFIFIYVVQLTEKN